MTSPAPSCRAGQRLASAEWLLVPSSSATRWLVPPTSAAADLGGHGSGSGALASGAIAPVERSVDTVTVPSGYDWNALIRWGDPLFSGAPAFDATGQTEQKAAQQFGYNCDYVLVGV